MNLLKLENLSKQFSERLLLDSVELMINEGDRIGLIGVNGSGKSTLLKLIAGELTPDDGQVIRWGNVRVEYLAQEPELDDSLSVIEQIFVSDSPQMQLLLAYEKANAALQADPNSAAVQAQLVEVSAEMDREGGWAAEANAKAILTRLNSTNFHDNVGTLSGGQRKRVALARALIDRADLLILDEPTNHIDADTVAWLEEYLAKAPGGLLMVTHDRYFLDRVANRIIELDRRQLVSYSGNYTQYLEGRAARHEKLAAAEQKRRKFLVRELEWARRAPMARGTKQKARKQRIEEMQEIQYDSGEDSVAIALGGSRLGKSVLTVDALTKRFEGDERAVVDGVNFELSPGDRLGILGPNGAGKSTFLNMLAGRLEPDSGSIEWGETVQVAYYDQLSSGLRDDQMILDFIEKEAPVIYSDEGERIEAARMLEWFLFSRPMQRAKIGSLSGGERRRLYLLRTLMHQPNVLLLDEPTNDLDIQTLAVLEQFLDHFTGCLIVVSHDRYFLDRTVDYIISYDHGRLGPRYPSPYETFKRLEAEANSKTEDKAEAKVVADDKGQAEDTRRQRAAKKKLSWKEQKELEMLEAAIETLEARQVDLGDQMSAAATDYVKLQALSADQELVEAELEEKMGRWLELSEMAG